MADITEIRCWPSCIDALDWSQDGIIALASDERIELVFPSTISLSRDNEGPQWQHVPLKAHLFSAEELPVKDPSPLLFYSIGEEISGSIPLAIAWSSPGLSKHRRCALGTLTGSLILSIWSAEGKMQEESSWSRKLIVNSVLADYFLDRYDEPSNHLDLSPEMQLRLRTRIRAFAWTPTLAEFDTPSILGTSLTYGPYFIAISNDDNEVVLLEINSPTSSLGIQQVWTARVITHFSIIRQSDQILLESTTFEDMMKQQRYASHVAWSPWASRDKRHHSVIAYASNTDVRARAVAYIHGKIILSDEIVYHDGDLRFNGPMKWCPTVGDGGTIVLALFTRSGLLCLTISIFDASITQRTSHNLDGRWDPISGVIWDTNVPRKPRLHFSSLLSTLHNPTAALEVHAGTLADLTSPHWRDQIENNLVLFNVQNDLKGNGRAKVWGLCTSPLKDFVATCNSVHPSDMIEYGPPAERRGIIAVSALRQYSQMRESFLKTNASAEGILFTLKKLVEHSVEDTDLMPEFAREMVGKLVQAYEFQFARNDGVSIAYSNLSDMNTLIEAFKRSVFLHSAVVENRFVVLVSHACVSAMPSPSSNYLSKAIIAYRLAKFVRSLPVELSSTSFSAEIIDHHQCLVALINEIINPNTVVSASPNTGAGNEGNAEIEKDGGNGDDGDNSDDIARQTDIIAKEFEASSPDTCDFCSAPIPFTDLASATCLQGHQFPRCGLSFLAIQAPDITKYCGICSAPFFSDEFVKAQEEEDEEEEEVGGGAVNETTATSINCDDQFNSTAEGSTSRNQISSEDIQNATELDTSAEAMDEQLPIPQHIEEGGNHLPPLRANAFKSSAQSKERQRKTPVVTLARLLFLSYDVCIYCGGKFVG